MQDLNDMVFFAEVVERGGFAAAGRVLGVPKSRLSRRVAELEDSLGVQLLLRNTRYLSLTPAGESYLRYCQALRDTASEAAAALAHVHNEPRGMLRICSPGTFTRTTLGLLLPRYLMRYPKVSVDLRVCNRPVDLFEEGLDIVFRVAPVIESSATVLSRRFRQIRPVLVANPAQLMRQGPVRDLADVARLDTLSRHMTEGRGTWQLKAPDGGIHVVQHAPRYVVDDLFLLKSAAVAGVGAVFLPDYMCREELLAGRLVEVLPGWEGSPLILHALFSARRALMPSVRALFDCLADHFKSLNLPDLSEADESVPPAPSAPPG